MIIFVYSVKMIFLSPTNMILPCYQKAKMIFSRKNTLKDDISGIIEKDDIYPRKYIFTDRKLKEDRVLEC